MAAIQAQDIDALVKTTEPKIMRGEMSTIAQKITKFVGFMTIWRGEKTELEGGTSVEWKINFDESHTAVQTGMFDTVAPGANAHVITANMPLRRTRSHTSWDIQELMMNRSSPEQLLKYTKLKIFEKKLSEANHIETQIWRGAVAGDDQSVTGLWGGWVFSPQDAGQTVSAAVNSAFHTSGEGARVNFNNANNPNGVAGVDRTLYPGIAPWYNQYTDVTYGDLIRRMRRGMDETDFESPVMYSKLGFGANRFGLYTTQEGARLFANEVRLQNEKIGPDVAYYDGKGMIRGVPVVGVPKLNELDAARVTPVMPFLQVDWGETKIHMLSGMNPYETTESGGGYMPTTVSQFTYWVWQLIAYNCKTFALYTKG